MRRLAPALALACSLTVLAGCQAKPAWLPSGAATAVGTTSLSPVDQALVERLAELFAAQGEIPVARRQEAPSVAGYKTQAAPVVEPRVTAGFYTGPFPGAGSLPANYRPRPVGGWLTQNPRVTTSGDVTTTETYYTPNGDTASPVALRKVVTRNGTTTQDLYASPDDAGTLPSFFANKLSLPAGFTTRQAEETYAVYEPGKTATGYRWAVRNATGSLIAWIRALQITDGNGTKVDKYEIFSDYEEGTPKGYAYGFYNETTRTGGELNETRDALGSWNSTGAWVDVANGKRTAYAQTVYPDGTVHKELTYVYGDQTLVTVEDYAADGSGSGVVRLNGAQRGTTSWDANGQGTLTLASGSAPYSATRAGLTPYPYLNPRPILGAVQ